MIFDDIFHDMGFWGLRFLDTHVAESSDFFGLNTRKHHLVDSEGQNNC